VVSGQWDVYDGTGPELMKGLFQGVAAGKSAPAALAASQRAFLAKLRAGKDNADPWFHPYFWAGLHRRRRRSRVGQVKSKRFKEMDNGHETIIPRPDPRLGGVGPRGPGGRVAVVRRGFPENGGAEAPAPAAPVADPAFDAFVDPALFGRAWADTDPALLTDLGLQMAEGDARLMRPHKGITSDEVLGVAAKDGGGEARRGDAGAAGEGGGRAGQEGTGGAGRRRPEAGLGRAGRGPGGDSIRRDHHERGVRRL